MTKDTTLHPYAIYHATNPVAMLRPDPRDWQLERDQQYQHVANVYALREQVFALSNHKEGRDWTQCPEVFWVAPGLSPRSTSVGDVVYSPSMGRAWLVTCDDLQEILPTSDGSKPYVIPVRRGHVPG
jgi:hypothetical protein